MEEDQLCHASVRSIYMRQGRYQALVYRGSGEVSRGRIDHALVERPAVQMPSDELWRFRIVVPESSGGATPNRSLEDSPQASDI